MKTTEVIIIKKKASNSTHVEFEIDHRYYRITRRNCNYLGSTIVRDTFYSTVFGSEITIDEEQLRKFNNQVKRIRKNERN